MLEATSPRERAIRLQLEAMLLAVSEEFSLVEERMELDLVHRWGNRRGGQKFLQMRDRGVAHAARARQPLLPDLQERLPRFVPQSRHGPMNQVEVDVLQTEFAAAPLEGAQRGLESMVAVPESRPYAYLLARDTAP